MPELLTINLTGIKEWQALTQDMIARAQDLSPVFEVMHEAWVTEMIEQFNTEGAYYDGEKWEALNPEYAKRKLKKYGPLPILIRTGRLIKSFIGEGGEHVKIIRPDYAEFGSSVPYAQWHQKGTDKMPQRREIKATDQLKQVGFRSAVKYILKGDAAPSGGH